MEIIWCADLKVRHNKTGESVIIRNQHNRSKLSRLISHFSLSVIFYICDSASSQKEFILNAFQHGLSDGNYVFYFIDSTQEWRVTRASLNRFGINIGFYVNTLIGQHEDNEVNFKGRNVSIIGLKNKALSDFFIVKKRWIRSCQGEEKNICSVWARNKNY